MNRNQLIRQYQPFVKKQASRIAARIDRFDLLDDLIGFGNEGLIKAVDKYDPRHGASLATYAHRKVRGAIFDGIRQSCWFPRKQRSNLKAAEAANHYLEASPPSGGEWSVSEGATYLTRAISGLATVCILSDMAEYSSEDNRENAEEETHKRQLRNKVQSCLMALNQKERAIIQAYYFDDEPVSQAANRLGLSRSWASRLHRNCIEKLQGMLGDYASESDRPSNIDDQGRPRSQPRYKTSLDSRPGFERPTRHQHEEGSSPGPGPGPGPAHLANGGLLFVATLPFVLAHGALKTLRSLLLPLLEGGLAQSTCLLVALFLIGCSVDLVGDLSHEQAQETALTLQALKIPASTKSNSGAGSKEVYSVQVPRAHLGSAVEKMGALGLPKQKPAGMAGLSRPRGLIPDCDGEKARLKQAMAGEVARALMGITGIVQAHVLVALDGRDPPFGLSGGLGSPTGTREQGTASVLLTCIEEERFGEMRPCPLDEDQVSRFVAGALAEVGAESVHVVMLPHRPAVIGGHPTRSPVTVTAKIGPWAVSPAARTPLLLLIVGLAFFVVLLSLLAASLAYKSGLLFQSPPGTSGYPSQKAFNTDPLPDVQEGI